MGPRLRSPLSSWLKCPHCHTRLSRTASARSFSTSNTRSASIAAAPTSEVEESDPPPISANARFVPESPSYFSRQPRSTDHLIKLRSLMEIHEKLPTLPPTEVPRIAWRTTAQYRVVVGESVRTAKYNKVLGLLRRLNRIPRALRSTDLNQTLDIYKAEFQPNEIQRRQKVVDPDGKASGVGKRKSSVAKVFLVQGSGQILVNGKSINNVFGRIHDRESALWALKITQRLDKYNVWALVKGGGTTGQAEAITLGLAKALLVHEPALKPVLRRGMLFTVFYCTCLPQILPHHFPFLLFPLSSFPPPPFLHKNQRLNP